MSLRSGRGDNRGRKCLKKDIIVRVKKNCRSFLNMASSSGITTRCFCKQKKKLKLHTLHVMYFFRENQNSLFHLEHIHFHTVATSLSAVRCIRSPRLTPLYRGQEWLVCSPPHQVSPEKEGKTVFFTTCSTMQQID